MEDRQDSSPHSCLRDSGRGTPVPLERWGQSPWKAGKPFKKVFKLDQVGWKSIYKIVPSALKI